MTDERSLAARAEHWARTLTAIPSVTGTKGEAEFADAFAALLRDSPAFGADRGRVWTVDVPGGAFARRAVAALVPGASRRTVVLTGHFDVVETSGYGALEPLAFDTERLGAALAARIAGEPPEERAARAREDLESGAFVAGRGLLDMKAGLAAGLAVIERLAAATPPLGLLFLAVPDEEGNSAGARHLAPLLPAMAAERGLELAALINLDATVDDGDGSAGRCVALGTVGKLLPSALVVGRAAHASDSFRGLNAGALAGAIAAEVEWSPDLTERTGDELGAAPTLLGLKDSRVAYDVTTPATVWLYWNVMVHRQSPEAVLEAIAAAARRGAERLLSDLRRRAQARGVAAAMEPVPVLLYRDLVLEAARTPGGTDAIRRLAAELADSPLSLPDRCRAVTEAAFRLSGRAGPAIVLGFASVPYLATELRDDPAATRLERAARAAIAAVARDEGLGIRLIRYFPGISDISFFGQAEAGFVPAIAGNTPVWPEIAGGGFGAAGIPSINVGPWGRDYHTRLERIHADYGFRVLPTLLLAILRGLASDGTSEGAPAAMHDAAQPGGGTAAR